MESLAGYRITITVVMTNGRSHLATYPTGYPTGEHDAVARAERLAYADDVVRVIVAHGPGRYCPPTTIREVPAVRINVDEGGIFPSPFHTAAMLREHIHDAYAEAARWAIIHRDRDRADKMIRARENAATTYADTMGAEPAAIFEMDDERAHTARLYAAAFN